MICIHEVAGSIPAVSTFWPADALAWRQSVRNTSAAPPARFVPTALVLWPYQQPARRLQDAAHMHSCISKRASSDVAKKARDELIQLNTSPRARAQHGCIAAVLQLRTPANPHHVFDNDILGSQNDVVDGQRAVATLNIALLAAQDKGSDKAAAGQRPKFQIAICLELLLLLGF